MEVLSLVTPIGLALELTGLEYKGPKYREPKYKEDERKLNNAYFISQLPFLVKLLGCH